MCSSRADQGTIGLVSAMTSQILGENPPIGYEGDICGLPATDRLPLSMGDPLPLH